MLRVVIVRPHRVQDGEDPPLAEGALGLAFSPPQDARVAELVEAWHHKAGLLPAFQADGTAVLQLYGHALHLLQWAWGELRMSSCSLSPALQQQVLCKKRKRGHGHWLAWGGVEEMPRSLKKETLPSSPG